VNRYIQVAVWVFLSPVFGAIQAVASFGFVMLKRGSGDSPDFSRLLTGLALVYGGAWFIPSLVASDLFLLRRTLSRQDFRD